MGTYDLLRDLLDQIRACTFDQNASCTYTYYVSMGQPSADCNSIAAWLDMKDRSSVNPDCATAHMDVAIKLMITRCCTSLDAQEQFDPTLEQKEAQCFLNDLDLLISCINCNLTAPEDMSCGYVLSSVLTDNEREGGCYSATLSIDLTEEECCG